MRAVSERHRLHPGREGHPDGERLTGQLRQGGAGRGWQTRVTPDLAEFLAGLDMFYLGTANAEGQPYIQYRGGPPGFLKVLDDRTLGLRRLRRQPPVHHAGQPVGEPQGVHLPDGLRQPASGSSCGARPGSSRTTPSCWSGSVTRTIRARSSGPSSSPSRPGTSTAPSTSTSGFRSGQVEPVIEELQGRIAELEAAVGRRRPTTAALRP